MPSGKMAAQVAHASVVPLVRAVQNGEVLAEGDQTINMNFNLPASLAPWMNGSFTKLILVLRTEEEWKRVEKKLIKNDVPYFIILDKGLTVFNGVVTHTTTGFYPMEQDDINKYFGNLPLLK